LPVAGSTGMLGAVQPPGFAEVGRAVDEAGTQVVRERRA